MNKNKHKSKGKRGSTADFEFGEFPFLDGVPSADAKEVANLRQQLADLQSRIDALMLEHCPDEMTPEQVAEWARNQVVVPK